MKRWVEFMVLAMVVLVCVCDVAHAGKKKAPVKLPPAPDGKTVVTFTGKFHGDTNMGWYVTPSEDGLGTGHTLWNLNIPSGDIGVYAVLDGAPEDLVDKDVTVKGCFGFKRAPAEPPSVLKIGMISKAGIAAGTGSQAEKKADALLETAQVRELVGKAAKKRKAKAEGKGKKKQKAKK